MKSAIAVVGLLGQALAEEVEANPIRRIVTLLQKMEQKVQEEGRKEEENYKKFQCYCKKNKEEIGAGGKVLKEKMSTLEGEIKKHKGAAANFRAQVQKLENNAEKVKILMKKI